MSPDSREGAHRSSDYLTILSKIILAKPTLSATTDVSLGDGLLMSSRARRTPAMMDAAITRVDANLSVMRFCSSIAFSIPLSVFLSWLYNQGHEIRVVSVMSLRGRKSFTKGRTT